MSDTYVLHLPSSGTGKTKYDRCSFKNESTERFGSKYRDPGNTKTLTGEFMPLGKAYGVIAVCMFGPGLTTEKHGPNVVFQECSHVHLEQGHQQDRSGVALSEGAGHLFAGVVNTALVCIRTDLSNSASTYGQHIVFSGLRASETKLHLGLDLNEFIMEE